MMIMMVTKYIQLQHDDNDGVISTSAGDLILSPNSGNVGIGTTGPIHTLQVSGSTSLGDGSFIISGGGGSTSYYDQISGAYYHTPGAMIRNDNAYTDPAQAEATLVLYNKNGTDNTGAKLVFANNETTELTANPVATAAIVGIKTSGTAGNWAHGRLDFLVKNGAAYTNSMSILDSGNVGIGTTAPGVDRKKRSIQNGIGTEHQ